MTEKLTTQIIKKVTAEVKDAFNRPSEWGRGKQDFPGAVPLNSDNQQGPETASLDTSHVNITPEMHTQDTQDESNQENALEIPTTKGTLTKIILQQGQMHTDNPSQTYTKAALSKRPEGEPSLLLKKNNGQQEIFLPKIETIFEDGSYLLKIRHRNTQEHYHFVPNSTFDPSQQIPHQNTVPHTLNSRHARQSHLQNTAQTRHRGETPIHTFSKTYQDEFTVEMRHFRSLFQSLDAQNRMHTFTKDLINYRQNNTNTIDLGDYYTQSKKELIEDLEKYYRIPISESGIAVSELFFIAQQEYHDAKRDSVRISESSKANPDIDAYITPLSALGKMSDSNIAAHKMSHRKLFGNTFDGVALEDLTNEQNEALVKNMQGIIKKWSTPVRGQINIFLTHVIRSGLPISTTALAGYLLPYATQGVLNPLTIGPAAHIAGTILTYIGSSAFIKKITDPWFLEMRITKGHKDLQRQLTPDGYQKQTYSGALQALKTLASNPFKHRSPDTAQRDTTMTPAQIEGILNGGAERSDRNQSRMTLLFQAMFGVGTAYIHWDAIQAALTPYIDQLSNIHMPEFSWPTCPDPVPDLVQEAPEVMQHDEPYIAPDVTPSVDPACPDEVCTNYWPANKY